MTAEYIIAYKGGRKYTFTKRQWENIKQYPKMAREYTVETPEVNLGGITVSEEILNAKRQKIEKLKESKSEPVIAPVVTHPTERQQAVEEVITAIEEEVTEPEITDEPIEGTTTSIVVDPEKLKVKNPTTRKPATRKPAKNARNKK